MRSLLLCLLHCCCITVLGQHTQVTKIESDILKAFIKKDTQLVKKYVDNQFMLIHADGIVQGKSDFVNAYNVFAPEHKLQISVQHIKFITRPDLVIINGVVTNQWEEGNMTVRSRAPYTDTYKKTNGNWLLISSFVNDVGEEYYVIRDTSGIRAAIARQYALLDSTIERKDILKHLSLKTNDFSTIDHLGNRASAQFMRNRSKILFNAMRDSIETTNTIESMEIVGDTAKVVVLQDFRRNQMLAGKVRRMETLARQRESWMLTREGWKLVFVDNVHPLKRVVDGKPTDATKPFNPNDPAFKN